MVFCATLFQGVAVWAGLPATLFALLLLLGYRLNTRFTWILLLLGVAGLATEGLSIACAGWATGTAVLPSRTGLMRSGMDISRQWLAWINTAWAVGAMIIILSCGVAIWRLSRPQPGREKRL